MLTREELLEDTRQCHGAVKKTRHKWNLLELVGEVADIGSCRLSMADTRAPLWQLLKSGEKRMFMHRDDVLTLWKFK